MKASRSMIEGSDGNTIVLDGSSDGVIDLGSQRETAPSEDRDSSQNDTVNLDSLYPLSLPEDGESMGALKKSPSAALSNTGSSVTASSITKSSITASPGIGPRYLVVELEKRTDATKDLSVSLVWLLLCHPKKQVQLEHRIASESIKCHQLS